MRDILFRGKRIDNGEWVEGYYYKAKYYRSDNELTDFITIPHPETEHKGSDHIIVIPNTVGQYTGLTDKNGKKIFEGDILQFDYEGKGRGVNGKGTVIFENAKFGVKWGWHNEFVCLDGFANTTLEVIGNIHDNPELLGGADNDQKRMDFLT